MKCPAYLSFAHRWKIRGIVGETENQAEGRGLYLGAGGGLECLGFAFGVPEEGELSPLRAGQSHRRGWRQGTSHCICRKATIGSSGRGGRKKEGLKVEGKEGGGGWREGREEGP